MTIKNSFSVKAWCCFAVILAPSLLSAGEVRVLLDLDRDETTGCDVVTPDGLFRGAEQMLITTFDPGTLSVTANVLAECIDAGTNTFDAGAAVTSPFPMP